MRARQTKVVNPVRVDLDNERIWQGERGLRLTPQAFSVLRCLLEHAGRLVTKEALFKTAWPDRVVSDDALSTCIREIRKVLGDAAGAPQYLESVHQRGYRFIGPLTTAAPPPGPRPSSLVGRAGELAQLQGSLAKTLRGERQVVFVTGEAGIGKTALVGAFLGRVAADPRLWPGCGQCIEHYGAGEAYLPVLEALGRLCRGPQGQRLIALLGRYVPSWLGLTGDRGQADALAGDRTADEPDRDHGHRAPPALRSQRGDQGAGTDRPPPNTRGASHAVGRRAAWRSCCPS